MSQEDDFETEVRRQHEKKLSERLKRRESRKLTRASTSTGLSMIERQALELASRAIAEDGTKKKGEYDANAPSEASSASNGMAGEDEEESGILAAQKGGSNGMDTQEATGRDFMGKLSKDEDSDEDIVQPKKKDKGARKAKKIAEKKSQQHDKAVESAENRFALETEKNLSSKEEANVVKGLSETQAEKTADVGGKDDDIRAGDTTPLLSREHHQNTLEAIEESLSRSIEQIHNNHPISSHTVHDESHKEMKQVLGNSPHTIVPTIDHSAIASAVNAASSNISNDNINSSMYPLTEGNVQVHTQETREALLAKLEHLKELKAAKMREAEIKREAEKLLAEREKNSPSQVPQRPVGIPQFDNGIAPPGEEGATYITLPVGARPPTGAVPIARVANQPQGILGMPPGAMPGRGQPPHGLGYPPSYHQGPYTPNIQDTQGLDKTMPMYGTPTMQQGQQSQPQSRNGTATHHPSPHQQQHQQQDLRYGHSGMHTNTRDRIVELESDEEGYGMGYKGPRIHIHETKESSPSNSPDASMASKGVKGKTLGKGKGQVLAKKKEFHDSDTVAPASGYDHSHTIPLKLQYSSHDSKVKDALLKVETTVLHGLVTVSAIDEEQIDSNDNMSQMGREYEVVAMFNCDSELHVVVMDNKVILHTNTEVKNMPALLKEKGLKHSVHLIFDDVKSAKQAAKAITSPVFANKPILRRDKRSSVPKGESKVAVVGGEPRPPSNTKSSALTKSPRRPSIKDTVVDEDHTENKDDGDNGENKNGNADGTTADDNQEEMTAEEKELDKSIAETTALLSSPQESPESRRKRLYDLHGSDSDESDGPASGKPLANGRTTTQGVSEEKGEIAETENGKRTFVSETSKLMFRKLTSFRPKLSRKEQVQKFKERDREHIRKQQEIRNAARIKAEKAAKKREYKDDLYKLKRDMLVDRFRSKRITEASINRTSLDGGSTLGPHEEVSVDHVSSYNYNRGLAPLVPVDSPETKRRRDQIRQARRIRKEEMQFIKGLEKIRLCDANRKASQEVAKEVHAARHMEREHKIAKLLHWENNYLEHTNKIMTNKFKHSQDKWHKQQEEHNMNKYYNNVVRDFEQSKVMDLSGVEIGGSSSYYGNYMSKLVLGSTDNTGMNGILEGDVEREEWGDGAFLNGHGSVGDIDIGEGGFSSTDDEESMKMRKQRCTTDTGKGTSNGNIDIEGQGLSLQEQQQASYVDMTSSRATYNGFKAQEGSYLRRFYKDKDYHVYPGKKPSRKKLQTTSMPSNKDFGLLTTSAITIQRIVRGSLVRQNKDGFVRIKAACVLQYWTLRIIAKKRLLELQHYARENARERLYAGSIIGYFIYRHWRIRQRLKNKQALEIFATDVNKSVKVREEEERTHRREALIEENTDNAVAASIEQKKEESIAKAERDKVRRQEKKEKIKEERKEAKEVALMFAEEEAVWSAKEIVLMQAEDVELAHYLSILKAEGKASKGSCCIC